MERSVVGLILEYKKICMVTHKSKYFSSLKITMYHFVPYYIISLQKTLYLTE